MKQEEYIKTINYKNHMVNVGRKQYILQYFLEYVDESGAIKEELVPLTQDDYQYIIEREFGSPVQCVYYGMGPCESTSAHGYCVKCSFNIFRKPEEKKDDKEEEKN